jgi:hypothetical protein
MYKYLYENYAEQKHKITGIKTVITSQWVIYDGPGAMHTVWIILQGETAK